METFNTSHEGVLEELPLKNKIVGKLLGHSYQSLVTETSSSSLIALITLSNDALIVFKSNKIGKEIDLITVINKSPYSLSELLLNAQEFLLSNYSRKLSLLASQSSSDSAFLRRQGYRLCLKVDGIEVFLKKAI